AHTLAGASPSPGLTSPGFCGPPVPWFSIGSRRHRWRAPAVGSCVAWFLHNTAIEYRSSVISPDIMHTMKIQSSLGFPIVLCAALAGCAAAPTAPGPLRVPADQV